MKYRSFAGAWCRSTRTMFSCLMFSAVAKPSDFRLLSKKSFDLSLLICFGNSVGHVQEEREMQTFVALLMALWMWEDLRLMSHRKSQKTMWMAAHFQILRGGTSSWSRVLGVRCSRWLYFCCFHVWPQCFHALFSFFVDLAFKSSIILLQASIEIFSQFCYFYAAARLLAFVPLAWYAFL